MARNGTVLTQASRISPFIRHFRGILQRALSAFPSSLPDDWDDRERMIASLDLEPAKTLKLADSEFLRISRSVSSRCLAYLRDNQERVLLEERT